MASCCPFLACCRKKNILKGVSFPCRKSVVPETPKATPFLGEDQKEESISGGNEKAVDPEATADFNVEEEPQRKSRIASTVQFMQFDLLSDIVEVSEPVSPNRSKRPSQATIVPETHGSLDDLQKKLQGLDEDPSSVRSTSSSEQVNDKKMAY